MSCLCVAVLLMPDFILGICISCRYDAFFAATIKGSWTPEEDALILKLVSDSKGPPSWAAIAKQLPGRIGKQCRERWVNHLDPTLKHTPFTNEEDELLCKLHDDLGNKWAVIARQLPGRSDNAVKNRWYSKYGSAARRDRSSGSATPAAGSTASSSRGASRGKTTERRGTPTRMRGLTTGKAAGSNTRKRKSGNSAAQHPDAAGGDTPLGMSTAQHFLNSDDTPSTLHMPLGSLGSMPPLGMAPGFLPSSAGMLYGGGFGGLPGGTMGFPPRAMPGLPASMGLSGDFGGKLSSSSPASAGGDLRSRLAMGMANSGPVPLGGMYSNMMGLPASAGLGAFPSGMMPGLPGPSAASAASQPLSGAELTDGAAGPIGGSKRNREVTVAVGSPRGMDDGAHGASGRASSTGSADLDARSDTSAASAARRRRLSRPHSDSMAAAEEAAAALASLETTPRSGIRARDAPDSGLNRLAASAHAIEAMDSAKRSTSGFAPRSASSSVGGPMSSAGLTALQLHMAGASANSGIGFGGATAAPKGAAVARALTGGGGRPPLSASAPLNAQQVVGNVSSGASAGSAGSVGRPPAAADSGLLNLMFRNSDDLGLPHPASMKSSDYLGDAPHMPVSA